jgi:hypothetical protein
MIEKELEINLREYRKYIELELKGCLTIKTITDFTFRLRPVIERRNKKI